MKICPIAQAGVLYFDWVSDDHCTCCHADNPDSCICGEVDDHDCTASNLALEQALINDRIYRINPEEGTSGLI